MLRFLQNHPATTGSVLTYPFDYYHIGLGVVIERTGADNKPKVLTPEETKGQLLITLDEQIARLHMTDLRVIDPKTVKPAKADFEYANAVIMNFERPVFLKIVVTILVLLTVMVALYTMVTQPFDQLVLNAGAVILGILVRVHWFCQDFLPTLPLLTQYFH